MGQEDQGVIKAFVGSQESAVSTLTRLWVEQLRKCDTIPHRS